MLSCKQSNNNKQVNRKKQSNKRKQSKQSKQPERGAMVPEIQRDDQQTRHAFSSEKKIIFQKYFSMITENFLKRSYIGIYVHVFRSPLKNEKNKQATGDRGVGNRII